MAEMKGQGLLYWKVSVVEEGLVHLMHSKKRALVCEPSRVMALYEFEHQSQQPVSCYLCEIWEAGYRAALDLSTVVVLS